ncbi:hypothetical protein RRG08_064985 [Elysia crispata]|uniref:Uncharacterized protein n=1 Tax=Elysia crispata TaxID=231223 RepID=A0AAE1CVM2_9GAST|nr:hypothetical protein RRG08_064985 [Elysia crispata]
MVRRNPPSWWIRQDTSLVGRGKASELWRMRGQESESLMCILRHDLIQCLIVMHGKWCVMTALVKHGKWCVMTACSDARTLSLSSLSSFSTFLRSFLPHPLSFFLQSFITSKTRRLSFKRFGSPARRFAVRGGDENFAGILC